VRKIKNPNGLIGKLRRMPGIVAVAPMVTGDAIATYGTKTLNLSIDGVEPEQQVAVTTIGTKLTEGNFGRLKTAADGIVLGRGVADMLGAGMNDIISLSSSTGGHTTAKVVGIFATV
jgi:lipoprotein-releasing system permease protein